MEISIFTMSVLSHAGLELRSRHAAHQLCPPTDHYMWLLTQTTHTKKINDIPTQLRPNSATSVTFRTKKEKADTNNHKQETQPDAN